MRILAAGDHFVRPDLLRAALTAELADLPAESTPEYADLTLPWPHEPFGPVGGVIEADRKSVV